MARRTFFSFHYEPDVSRAWVARNSWVTKVALGEREDAGFFDSSVFEAKERESPEVLKRFLREGLRNTTVTCVLVGARTTLRRWVRYEIIQSFIRGNGLLAVRVHSIRNLDNKTAERGGNPFDALAFRIDDDRVRFQEYFTTGWGDARDVGSMPIADVVYDLGSMNHHTFACLFPIYEWEADEGYKNLGKWIEEAAGSAGH
jgi:MTH538 TIR-like domain (DUF1863)